MVVFQEGLDDAFGRATLESLYRDRIPPFLANLQCRWQEIITEYQKATGIQLPPRKLTVQDLLRMFADRPTTLVIVDQEGDASVRLETTHSMLLKEMELRPGKPISPHIARREVTANRKLYDTPEVFFAGFRTTPVSFEGFIDPFSPDVYPDSMWINFTAWLDGLKWQNAEISRFHGGRYGAAKEISRWELPFFHRRSLGEMIHIVQLALTSKDRGGRGLLSYQPDKTIAPCSFSEHQCDVEKNIRALLGINSLPHHVPPRYGQVLPYVGEGCASDAERWAELRDVLHAVLSHFPEGRSVALLKMEIERRCGLILDQRVFGKEKLSHVFESPELMEYFDMRREVQVGSDSKVLVVQLKDVQPSATQVLKAALGLRTSEDPQAALGLRTFEDPQATWQPLRPLPPVVAQPPTLVDHPNPKNPVCSPPSSQPSIIDADYEKRIDAGWEAFAADWEAFAQYEDSSSSLLATEEESNLPQPSPSGGIASDTIADVHATLSLASTKLGDGMSESEGVAVTERSSEAPPPPPNAPPPLPPPPLPMPPTMDTLMDTAVDTVHEDTPAPAMARLHERGRGGHAPVVITGRGEAPPAPTPLTSKSEGVDMRKSASEVFQALRESAMRSEMERRGVYIGAPSLSQESVSENTSKTAWLLCL